MKFSFLRNVAFYAAALVAADSSFAVVAQEPLLSKTVNVRPNIALVLDTSGSMDWECVYAKHVSDALLKEYSGSVPGFHVDCVSSGLSEFAPADLLAMTVGRNPRPVQNPDPRQISPINNLLYYNPHKVYGPGYLGGVLQPNATVNNNSVVTLYLPKPGPTNDPTTFTSSAELRDLDKYESYQVTTTTFRKNNANTASNPFGAHGGSRTDCAAAACTLTEERRNIANWRAFHIDRIKSAKTGLSGAFASQADNFRLAYGDITGSPTVMKDFGLTKSAFYTWLDARSPTGATPLRGALDNAGKYYQNTANAGPWGSKPWAPPTGETPANHLSCRRSFTLMITDGFYTDAAPTGVGDVDGTTGTEWVYALDSNKKYKYIPGDSNPKSKGKSDKIGGTGGVSNTLADIALKYWVNDLRPDLPNDAGKGDVSDPPFWQNMTSYMVSFGAPGKMTEDEVTQAKGGTFSWVTPTLNTVTTIDDMRHAAHNGGGGFLTVNDAAQFTTDLGNVIGSIASQQFSQAGVAASAVTLSAGTKKFIPFYISGTWWGNVQMFDLAASGGAGDAVWSVIGVDGNGQPTGVTTLPAPAARNIFVWTDAAKQGLAFTYANVTTAANNLRGTNANFQMSNAVTSDMVDFLRGVRTKEGAGMRKRPAVLGDIVNSTPAFLKNNTNPMYEKLPVATPGLDSYAAYMASKAARTEGVLFVGSNDGMLHAFGEGSGSSVGGRELFAYVPRSVLGKVEALTASGYTFAHTFMVDGPLSEADAYVTTPDLTGGGTSIGWRNLVLGTTGAGAKSVFALNATNLLGMNGKAVLWEINADPAFPVLPGNSTTSFAELGNVLSAVQSGITASGEWVTVFGNGYDSKSGQASLYIVETGTGKLLREITTDTTAGNGLGGVRLVLNDKRQIIGAYAGDLKGRLWKFDLSSAASSGWALGNGGVPLFTAQSGGTPLPITAQPAVLARTDQPSFLPSYLITVGTGKLFEAGDPAVTTPVQAVYGLWDKKPFGSLGSDSITESQLEAIKATAAATGIDPSTGNTLNAGGVTGFYGVSFVNPAVTSLDWSVRRGWKLSLDVFPGQRTVYPISMQDDVVKFDTVAPQASSSSCLASTSNASSFFLDPLTAACRLGGTLDTNGDGNIDASDANVCSYTSLADGTDVVLTILSPTGEDTGLRDIQNSSGHIMVRTKNPPPPQNCTNPVYAAAHVEECGSCADAAYASAHESECQAANCASAAYRAAHPGACPGAALNRSWRQLFPRAN